jgi:hypothetical protein
MPEGQQKHRTVPLAPAVALGGVDQLLDFALGQVLAWPKLAVGAAGRPNCPFYVAGETSLRRVFAICFKPPGTRLSVYSTEYGQLSTLGRVR